MEDDITKCIQLITKRISTMYIPERLVGLDECITQLKIKLDLSIKQKQSSSILISGPARSGKSTLFRYCLRDYNVDDYAIVDASGLKYTSDQQILKQIAEVLEIDIPKVGIVDILTTIKTYLGRESLDSRQDNIGNSNINRKPVIVLMDDFEHMVKSTNKQQLLYNLLDLSHYRDVSLSFIAITSQSDIVNSFEKRVKSRFTQMRIQVNLPDSLEQMIQIIYNILSLPSTTSQTPNLPSPQYTKIWNDTIHKLLYFNQKIKKTLEFQFKINISPVGFFRIIDKSLQFLNNLEGYLTEKMLLDGYNMVNGDETSFLLDSLTTFDLSMLGCIIKAKDRKRYGEAISFQEVFNNEYKYISTSYYKIDLMDQVSCIQSVQKLCKLDLIRKEGTKTGEFIEFKLAIDPDLYKSNISNRDDCPTTLKQYICQWLE